MISEMVAIAVAGGLGVGVLAAAGGRSPWLQGVLALPVGIAGVSLVGLAVIAAGLRPLPVVILGLSLLAAILIPVFNAAGRRPPLLGSALVISLLAVLAGVFYRLGLVTATPDSYLYMSVGSILEVAGPMTVPAPSLQRGAILPVLHSTGATFYLRSLAPLVAVSTLGGLVWLSSRALGSRARTSMGRAVLVGIAALLVTNNRFIFNSFYVNTHMLFAIWVLIVVAVPWLVAVGKLEKRMLLVVAVVLPALAVLRPEASLLGPLLVVGLLQEKRIGARWKSRLLLIVGGVTLVWQATLLRSFGSQGRIPIEVVLLVAVGAAIALAGAGWKWLEPYVAKLLAPALLVSLMLGWALMGILESQLFANSISATIDNVVLGEGLYGVSILVLVALLMVGALRRVPSRRILTFPLLVAPPFLFLMAHLRSESAGAYRVGPGDSLNRMLLHWLPLAAFFLVALATDARDTPAGSPRSAGDSRPVDGEATFGDETQAAGVTGIRPAPPER